MVAAIRLAAAIGRYNAEVSSSQLRPHARARARQRGRSGHSSGSTARTRRLCCRRRRRAHLLLVFSIRRAIMRVCTSDSRRSMALVYERNFVL